MSRPDATLRRLLKSLNLALRHPDTEEGRAALEAANNLYERMGGDLADAYANGAMAEMEVEIEHIGRLNKHVAQLEVTNRYWDERNRQLMAQAREQAAEIDRLKAEVTKRSRSRLAAQVAELSAEVERLRSQTVTDRPTADRDRPSSRTSTATAAKMGRARAKAEAAAPRIRALKADGLSLAEIARRMNDLMPGPAGGQWSAQAVRRALRTMERP